MPSGKYIRTEKTKINLSKRPRTQETKQKISKALYGRTLSEKHKKSIRETHLRVDKHPLWKGGVWPLNGKIRKSFEYRQWRSDVFTRDDFTCQECGLKDIRIVAHHKKSFALILVKNSIKTFDEAISCEELWNINNGLTLCKECHKKLGNDRPVGYKKREFQAQKAWNALTNQEKAIRLQALDKSRKLIKTRAQDSRNGLSEPTEGSL